MPARQDDCGDERGRRESILLEGGSHLLVEGLQEAKPIQDESPEPNDREDLNNEEESIEPAAAGGAPGSDGLGDFSLFDGSLGAPFFQGSAGEIWR